MAKTTAPKDIAITCGGKGVNLTVSICICICFHAVNVRKKAWGAKLNLQILNPTVKQSIAFLALPF